jgi:hypothetical protein
MCGPVFLEAPCAACQVRGPNWTEIWVIWKGVRLEHLGVVDWWTKEKKQLTDPPRG